VSRLEALVADWRRSCRGDAWHGPSLAALLETIDADAAAAHPIAGGHSIREIVLHVAAWTREVARRLEGGEPALPVEGDWPAPVDPAAATWPDAIAALRAAQARLEEALIALPETRLDARVGGVRDAPLGTGVTFEAMISGALQHNAYHGGQIALLARAATRPDRIP
jgi:uncharacterized damage-inducible protein DinB